MDKILQEKSITSENGRTFYWVSQKDKEVTIVFLPGLTANHTLFEKQIMHFYDRYNIVVWDCPCHGKSRPYKNFNYANVSKELNTILKAEGAERIVIVGQSLGGMIGQYYIDAYPEGVLGFVSIDSAPFGDYYSKSDFFWLNQLEWMCKLYPDKVLRKSMAKMCGATLEARTRMESMLSDYPKKELCHLMYVGEAAFIPENKSITFPCDVILILGDRDRVGKVAAYNKKWANKTGYPLVVVKNAAHNSNDDNPEEVNKILDDFLQSVVKKETGEIIFQEEGDERIFVGELQRPDIIARDYWSVPDYREFNITLLNNVQGLSGGEKIKVNAITGEIDKMLVRFLNRGPCIYDAEDKLGTVTDEEVREFAKTCSEELGNKFSAFTSERWKDFISEEESKYIDDLIEECYHPKSAIKEKPQSAREEFDFDAYSIVSRRMHGDCSVFLRKTESGWRAFSISPGLLSVHSGHITEENILNTLQQGMRGKLNTYRCEDRKLSNMDMNYIAELLPDSHPEIRNDGKAMRSIKNMTPTSIEAYYLKNGYWIPCADFSAIDALFDRIGEVARFCYTYS